jgi:hypothetical protein
MENKGKEEVMPVEGSQVPCLPPCALPCSPSDSGPVLRPGGYALEHLSEGVRESSACFGLIKYDWLTRDSVLIF